MGFDVNGIMDENENLFSSAFCDWEMVSGDYGTYLRSINLKHDFEKGCRQNAKFSINTKVQQLIVSDTKKVF